MFDDILNETCQLPFKGPIRGRETVPTKSPTYLELIQIE